MYVETRQGHPDRELFLHNTKTGVRVIDDNTPKRNLVFPNTEHRPGVEKLVHVHHKNGTPRQELGVLLVIGGRDA